MLTNDEILKRGHAALRLLADDDMMWFFEDLKKDIMSASFSAAGTDSAQRESVYFQLKGVHDVLERMTTYSKAAEDILYALNEPVIETYDD